MGHSPDCFLIKVTQRSHSIMQSSQFNKKFNNIRLYRKKTSFRWVSLIIKGWWWEGILSGFQGVPLRSSRVMARPREGPCLAMWLLPRGTSKIRAKGKSGAGVHI